jgi:hypothetical protein
MSFTTRNAFLPPERLVAATDALLWASGSFVVSTDLPDDVSVTLPTLGRLTVDIPAESPLAALRAEIEALRGELHALKADAMNHPRQALVATLGAPGLRLRFPVPVEIHHDADGVVVNSLDFEVFAHGEDEPTALQAWREAVAKEYRFYSEHEADLGPAPAAQFARLREAIDVVEIAAAA